MKNSSLWLSGHESPQFPALSSDLDVDVCVIGGGITGVTTAYLLEQRGFSVALLEASIIGGGVSGHTSGHLTSMVDTYYHSIIEKHGLEAAIHVREATTRARDLAEEIINSNFLAAGFKRVSGHYFATTQTQLKALDEEREAMLQAGFQIAPLFVWRYPFEILGGFSLPDQAVINAAAYALGLAKKCNGRGVKVCEDTRVTGFSRKNGRWLIDAGGFQVNAAYMVQATHTPLGFNPVQMEMKPMNSYVLAGKTEAEVVPGLFYDMAEPYHYIRNCDYRGDKMLIIGGCDSKPGEKMDQDERIQELIDYAKTNFRLTDVSFTWGSMYFEPADGLPYIGKDPIHENAFISTGYSGDGLTFGLVGAILLAGLIDAGEHPWQKTFNPSRLKLAAMPEVLKENASVLKNFVGERLRLSSEYMPELRRGEGKVLKVDGQTVGIAADEEGVLYAVEPVCTHMGCVLNWNNALQTWDCGCHGSRFNCRGEVVAGPATKNLSVIEVRVEEDAHHQD